MKRTFAFTLTCAGLLLIGYISAAEARGPLLTPSKIWGTDNPTTDIMLQGFRWQTANNRMCDFGNYYKMMSFFKVGEISDAKISIVWFPPPSKTSRQDLLNDGFNSWFTGTGWTGMACQHDDPASAIGYVPMDYYDLGEFMQKVQDEWPLERLTYCLDPWISASPSRMNDGNWYNHAVSGYENSGIHPFDKSRYLYGGETLYGSKDELLEAIDTFHAKNIKVIADVVLAHRSGMFTNGIKVRPGERACSGSLEVERYIVRWGDPGIANQVVASAKTGSVVLGADMNLVRRMAWGALAANNSVPLMEIATEWGGAGINDGELSVFASDVCHGNSNVKEEFKAWLFWLKNTIGFDGWRYDYVKGLSSNHIRDYNDFTQPYISVGEHFTYSQEFNPGVRNENNNIYTWIDNSNPDNARKSMAFDFPLKFHLTKVFKGGKPFRDLRDWNNSSTLIGGWSAKAVTFLDNHDTAEPHPGANEFPNDTKRLLQGYAFLLTHPGLPCVFYKHMFEHPDTNVKKFITKLCQFRVDKSINNQSSVSVLHATDDIYAAQINTNVCIKIGDGSWSPESGWVSMLIAPDGFSWNIWIK